MIYTITFNPAIDYISEVDNLELGKINRTKSEKILPGGKGVNVSIVLKNLGIETTILGFIGGFTGEELKKQINQKQIKTDFIKVQNGFTRINVKINSNNNLESNETAINGNGPEISEEDIKDLIQKIKQIKKEDLVILSGNIPRCIKKDIYAKICDVLFKNEVTFVVDATQKLLVSVLQYEPFLIKPNKQELEETFNVEILSKQDILIYAKKLQERGAKNVLVSLGGDGAILVTTEGEAYYIDAPKGQVLTTVGAGDSMVAGFIVGYLEKGDFKKALKLGIAAGSASAFSKDLATKEEVEKLIKNLKIQKI